VSRPLPADHYNRYEPAREGIHEVKLRCDSCQRPWIVFAHEGEANRACPFCGDGHGERLK
jgi:rubrerythrin